MYNKVEICGVNTATLKVLNESEKMRLLRLTKEGNEQARDDLVKGNLRLVLSVVQRFTQRGENLDDLFQVGCIGLIKSIDNFDITQNVRFSTYAVPTTMWMSRILWKDTDTLIKRCRYPCFSLNNFSSSNEHQPYRSCISISFQLTPDKLPVAPFVTSLPKHF